MKYNNKSFNRKKKNLRVLPIDNRIHIKIITINLNTHKLNGTHTKIKKGSMEYYGGLRPPAMAFYADLARFRRFLCTVVT